MNSKKCFKAIFFSIIIIILINIYAPFTYASTAGGIITGGDDFISSADSSSYATIKNDSLRDISSNIYNILLIIGIVIAIFVGLILGIQFILGSVEEKGKVKESLIPYFAGCIVIFGAFGIWKLVVTILQGVS